MYCARWSNEAATVHADITADHRDVPTSFVNVDSYIPLYFQAV